MCEFQEPFGGLGRTAPGPYLVKKKDVHQRNYDVCRYRLNSAQLEDALPILVVAVISGQVLSIDDADQMAMPTPGADHADLGAPPVCLAAFDLTMAT